MTKAILAFTAFTLLSFVATFESYAKGGSRGGSHASSSRSSSHGASHSVRGYTKKNGTYVAPHRKTSPDKAKSNNYDSKGNITTVRLKVEQIQLVSDVGLIRKGWIGLQGA